MIILTLVIAASVSAIVSTIVTLWWLNGVDQ